MDDIDRIIKTINEQKGEMMAMQCLLASVFRALPADRQALAFAKYDKDVEIARTVLLNSHAPDAVHASFDRAVDALNELRSIKLRAGDEC